MEPPQSKSPANGGQTPAEFPNLSDMAPVPELVPRAGSMTYSLSFLPLVGALLALLAIPIHLARAAKLDGVITLGGVVGLCGALAIPCGVLEAMFTSSPQVRRQALRGLLIGTGSAVAMVLAIVLIASSSKGL